MTSEEIKKAMREFTPVRYEGITYRRITAFIFRIIESRHRHGVYREILQLELESYCGNSVTIAEAEKVELISNDGHSENN